VPAGRSPGPREPRALAWYELAAVVACVVIGALEILPVALPLFVAATASRWLRGRAWFGEGRAEQTSRGKPITLSQAPARSPARATRDTAYLAALGVIAGAVALGLAIVVTTRGIATLSQRPFGWAEDAMARGDVVRIASVALHVAVTALALELALRGWIVERVLELSPGGPILPICVGAIAEALVTPGDGATRVGAALLGAGLGTLYVAGGRSVVAGSCARIVFQAGAVVLEGLRLVE
jgi:hypothetical protein